MVIGRLVDGPLVSRVGILFLGFVLGTVLTLNALVFYHNTRVLVDNERMVSHTQTVLSTLDATSGHVAEAQNGLRAYLFAGDADDLRRGRRAVTTARADLSTLARLTADNADEQRRIRTLRGLAPATIPANVLPDGLPVEYVNLHQTEGPAHDIAARLDRMQTVITTMRSTEVGLLQKRTDQANRSATGTYATLAVATIADLALLAGLLGFVFHALQKRAERARAQAALLQREQAARAEAEAAVAMRDAFLSLASHELKTPLTAVLGNAQLLQHRLDAKRELTGRDAPRLQALTRGARHLVTLVDQLLDVSRLQGDQLELSAAPLDLVEVVRRSAENAQHSARDHRIVVKVAADAESMIVRGDEVRLEQALSNLLTNAVKFSPHAELVTVEVTRGDGVARVAVTDYGIGIPAEALTRLFDRFYRAPNTAHHAVSGLGIGLYVVNEIVTRHGGTIHVASVEGQGSTFTVETPLMADAPTCPAASPQLPLQATLG